MESLLWEASILGIEKSWGKVWVEIQATQKNPKKVTEAEGSGHQQASPSAESPMGKAHREESTSACTPQEGWEKLSSSVRPLALQRKVLESSGATTLELPSLQDTSSLAGLVHSLAV